MGFLVVKCVQNERKDFKLTLSILLPEETFAKRESSAVSLHNDGIRKF